MLACLSDSQKNRNDMIRHQLTVVNDDNIFALVPEDVVI